MDVRRSRDGRAIVPSTTIVSAPRRWAINASDRPMSAVARPSEFQRAERATRCSFGRRGLAIDEPHLVDQGTIGVGEVDDAGGGTARGQRAGKALDQPSAERIQPLQFLQVDVDALRILAAPGAVNDDPLKLRGSLGCPGAAK